MSARGFFGYSREEKEAMQDAMEDAEASRIDAIAKAAVHSPEPAPQANEGAQGGPNV